MKNFLLSIQLMLFLVLLQSCDLTNDDVPACDKNAPISLNESDRCANAIALSYSNDPQLPKEQITLKFVFGGGTFQIGLNTSSITTTTYSYPGDVDFSFPELNKGGSGTVTITKIDREERKISGSFNLSAEAAANYTAYDYRVSGSFTDVSF